MRSSVVALQLFLLPAVAFAETSITESIEWMVADSDLIVRARFRGRVDIESGPAGFSVSSYRVEDTLLGESRKQIDVLARDLEIEEAGVKDAEYLLFLWKHCRRFKDPKLSAVADRTPFELRAWVRLDASFKQYTMACEMITKRADLLDSVRRAERHTRDAVIRPTSHWLEVPTGTSSFPELYGGSAVYMVVPVDRRLVRLARAWANSEEQDRRQAAEESVRVSHARARALERIAGAAAPTPKESDDFMKRLARAEAGVAVPWRRVVRALEACDGGKLQEALIRLRLSRLSPRPEDRAAVVEVFRHDFDALTAAAQQTLWPIVLDVRREGTDRVVDLCERIEGRVAFNVLRLRAWSSGELQYVTTVEERLYCFRDEAGPPGLRAFFVDLLAYSRAGLLRDTIQSRVEPRKWRGAAQSAPATMKLGSLHLSPENVEHWKEAVPWDWPSEAPAWSAPFLFAEFKEAFPPDSPNRKGETDPERR